MKRISISKILILCYTIIVIITLLLYNTFSVKAEVAPLNNSDTYTYKMPDLDLAVTVSNDLVGFTQNTTSNNSYLEKIGASDVEQVRALLMVNNIYLELIPKEGDITYEILVSGKNAPSQVSNFNEVSDDVLKGYFDEYIDSANTQKNEETNIKETITDSYIEKLNGITLSFGGQEYSGTQIASMSFDSFDFVGDAQKARKEVAKAIKEIFGADGYDENEKKIILSLGFEVSDDGELIDTQDIVPKLAEALGLNGDDFLAISTKWGIEDWTPEQLKRVYELVNKGIINKDTTATGVYYITQSEPQNAKESQIRRDYLSENYQDTGTDITQYLLDVKNGLIEDVDDNVILEKWGLLGSGMV